MEAAELLTVANRRAARIIQEAEEKATETAGEAMKALREAQDLEGIVVSLLTNPLIFPSLVPAPRARVL